MRVRITSLPVEHELDGVRLDNFEVGNVCEVSPSIGSWLVAQGYAELEMRSVAREGDWKSAINRPTSARNGHRRSTDR